MNSLQITTITLANNLGDSTAKRKIGYTGSFSDGTYTEGFILLNDEEFLKTNFFDITKIIRNKLIENLGGEINGK